MVKRKTGGAKSGGGAGGGVYIALIRAVNVGGTGKLPMDQLRSMCETEGFTNVRTLLASGNVLFASVENEKTIKSKLEKSLAKYAGKPVSVIVRSAAEMRQVLAANPFPDAPGNHTMAIFLDEFVTPHMLRDIKGRDAERIEPGIREIYVQYDKGMGSSRLVIPAAKQGTARNMNTVARLVDAASV